MFKIIALSFIIIFNFEKYSCGTKKNSKPIPKTSISQSQQNPALKQTSSSQQNNSSIYQQIINSINSDTDLMNIINQTQSLSGTDKQTYTTQVIQIVDMKVDSICSNNNIQKGSTQYSQLKTQAEQYAMQIINSPSKKSSGSKMQTIKKDFGKGMGVLNNAIMLHQAKEMIMPSKKKSIAKKDPISEKKTNSLKENEIKSSEPKAPASAEERTATRMAENSVESSSEKAATEAAENAAEKAATEAAESAVSEATAGIAEGGAAAGEAAEGAAAAGEAAEGAATAGEAIEGLADVAMIFV
jgi:hypothetical protein